MNLRIWPQGLIGRVTFVLMCAVVLEFVLSSIAFDRTDIYTTRVEQAHHLAEQLVVAERALTETPRSKRPLIAHNMSTDKAKVRWTEQPLLPKAATAGSLARLHNEMQEWEASLAGRDLRLGLRDGRTFLSGKRLVTTVQLTDGTWAAASSQSRTSPWAMLLAGVGSAAVLSAGVAIAAILLLRSMGTPLRALAHAADNVGQGAPVHVREEGAGDLRQVARAFNAMQTRINELLTSRTQALAAVSHDLRTPLSRLRLRAGLVSDPETRGALEADVDEMAAMLDSLLAYLGGRHETETPRLIDVAAMCMTLVDAATDAGAQATYEGPDHLPARIRSLAIKRALDNLIQNAIVYGGRAGVRLSRKGSLIVIGVDDDGPGIPEADIERVKEAFIRLDGARARNTSGLGLGLSIVQKTAVQEGGEFVLRNRAEGGLCAELHLPYHA